MLLFEEKEYKNGKVSFYLTWRMSQNQIEYCWPPFTVFENLSKSLIDLFIFKPSKFEFSR